MGAERAWGEGPLSAKGAQEGGSAPMQPPLSLNVGEGRKEGGGGGGCKGEGGRCSL